ILVAILGLVGMLLYFIAMDILRKKTWAPRILDSVFLEVSMPKENADNNKDQDGQKEQKDIIGIAEQFFATITQGGERGVNHFLGINDYIGLEIAAHHKKISFYINVPKRLQDLVEKQ